MLFLAATLVGWIGGDFVYSDHYTEHDQPHQYADHYDLYDHDYDLYYYDHDYNDNDNDHTSDHQSVINN